MKSLVNSINDLKVSINQHKKSALLGETEHWETKEHIAVYGIDGFH